MFSLTNLAGAAFLSQNIYFLITAGLEAVHSFDIGIGGFAFAAILIACSGVYLQKVSRRNAILGGLIFNLVFMTIIGALYFASGEGSLWAIAILMNVLISFQTAILQSVGWAVAAEVPTPNLRAKTLSLGLCGQTLTTWLFQFVTPYMYNVDSSRLGSRVGFVHALELLHQVWGTMADESNPNYSGAHWEAMDGQGNPFNHEASLAHGWSTWPVFLLPRYLAGLHPLEPGWKTVGISPILADLDEVTYGVESGCGLIKIAILIDSSRERGIMRLTLPVSTKGVVSLPGPWKLLGCREFRGDAEEIAVHFVRR
jgi:hypothetical protein